MSTKSKLNHLKDRLSELERYYNSACVQLAVLNVAMEELTKRYENAEKICHRTSRYSLRMRMAVVEGVRNMFYEFATWKAVEISKIRQQILVEHAFFEESGEEVDENYVGYGYEAIYLEDDDDTMDDEEEDSDGTLDEDGFLVI